MQSDAEMPAGSVPILNGWPVFWLVVACCGKHWYFSVSVRVAIRKNVFRSIFYAVFYLKCKQLSGVHHLITSTLSCGTKLVY